MIERNEGNEMKRDDVNECMYVVYVRVLGNYRGMRLDFWQIL